MCTVSPQRYSESYSRYAPEVQSSLFSLSSYTYVPYRKTALIWNRAVQAKQETTIRVLQGQRLMPLNNTMSYLVNFSLGWVICTSCLYSFTEQRIEKKIEKNTLPNAFCCLRCLYVDIFSPKWPGWYNRFSPRIIGSFYIFFFFFFCNMRAKSSDPRRKYNLRLRFRSLSPLSSNLAPSSAGNAPDQQDLEMNV